MTHSRLAQVTGWSLSTAERVLEELTILGLYEVANAGVIPDPAPGPGRSPQIYLPTPGIEWVLNATFEEDSPRSSQCRAGPG